MTPQFHTPEFLGENKQQKKLKQQGISSPLSGLRNGAGNFCPEKCLIH
jgi:hypothetical protein